MVSWNSKRDSLNTGQSPMAPSSAKDGYMSPMTQNSGMILFPFTMTHPALATLVISKLTNSSLDLFGGQE